MMKIKVAISQRIIPHYRLPVFRELAQRKNIDLTVFYGKGLDTGSQANAKVINGFNSIRLNTIILNYSGIYKSTQLRVLHPALMFHLIFGNYDVVIVEPSTNFYNNIFNFSYCKIFRKKFIWHDAGSIPKKQRPFLRRLIDPLLSFFIRNADAYITYNSFADMSLIRDHKINSKFIFRAQNTVDTLKIENEVNKYKNKVSALREKLSLKGKRIAMYMGGLEKRKKINYLITATSNLNNEGIPARTIIIGDGEDKQWILDNMSKKEKEHTLFLGKIVDKATLYILLSDIVVLPSSGGLSVVQSLVCSKPFIGSEEIEHGGIKDYITHNENGFLFKEDNILELTEYIRILFTNDNQYLTMSQKAYESSKKISIAKMVDGYENAIKHTYEYTTN